MVTPPKDGHDERGQIAMSTIALALLNAGLIALTIEVWRIGKTMVACTAESFDEKPVLPNLSVLYAPMGR